MWWSWGVTKKISKIPSRRGLQKNHAQLQNTQLGRLFLSKIMENCILFFWIRFIKAKNLSKPSKQYTQITKQSTQVKSIRPDSQARIRWAVSSQSTDQSTNIPTNQHTNQPINQPTDRATNQPTNQLTNQPATEPRSWPSKLLPKQMTTTPRASHTSS